MRGGASTPRKNHVNKLNERFSLKTNSQKVFVHFFQKVAGFKGEQPLKKRGAGETLFSKRFPPQYIIPNNYSTTSIVSITTGSLGTSCIYQP